MGLTETYADLKARVVERKGEFDSFISMLESETSWLTSPASTRFHLNCEQGLLKHSVAVAESLLKIRDCLAPPISDESCVIVGLFHDVGKVGMPGQPLYIRNTNQWEVEHRNITFKTNQQMPYMGQAARSLYLVGKYISLSDAEVQAILYHDGQYIEDNRCVAHKEEPLTLLLHWADYWAAHIFEEGRKLVDDTSRYAPKGSEPADK